MYRYFLRATGAPCFLLFLRSGIRYIYREITWRQSRTHVGSSASYFPDGPNRFPIRTSFPDGTCGESRSETRVGSRFAQASVSYRVSLDGFSRFRAIEAQQIVRYRLQTWAYAIGRCVILLAKNHWGYVRSCLLLLLAISVHVAQLYLSSP